MPLVLDEEFSKKLLKKMFALLAIFFRILEPFDLNTSFVHEMDLFFIYPNCIHKNSYFPPLCTVFNIAWRVYSIYTHPLESGAEKTDQSSTTSTLGPLIKNLTYIFFREKKSTHTMRLSTISEFLLVLLIFLLIYLLCYTTTKYHCLKNQLNTPPF